MRLTPKGGRDAVDGLAETPDGPALKARVRAAPEDGEANAALVDLVAGWLAIPRREVTLVGGHKSRTKMLSITAEAAVVEPRLIAGISALESKRPERT